jgi:xylan 1,4-beta-xylosidase
MTRIDKFLPSLLLGGCVLLFGGMAYAEEVPAPAERVIEAESSPPASDNVVVDDETASGGQAVMSIREWEPVFRTDELAEENGRVTIWVRYKGGPVQLKTSVDGKQTDRDWAWGKPTEFKWAKLGTYNAADLGDEIIIIRGQFDGETVVDAIAVEVAEAAAVSDAKKPNIETPENAGDAGIAGAAAGGGDELPANRPDPDAPPQTVDLTIDWNQTVAQMPRELWGVSLYGIVNPTIARREAYVDWLTDLRPALVRVHNAEMTQQWWDEEAKAWDVEVIESCFAPHRAWMASTGVDLMMCVPFDWPASVIGADENSKYLPPERYDAGMENLRDLVEILVDDLGLPITHWEVSNEWDNTYEKLGKLDELWPLIGRMADVIREVSPDTEVGGPAMTWPKEIWVRGLLDEAGDKLDFISWHGYALGEPTVPNAKLITRPAEMAEHAADVHEMMAARDLDDLPTYVTEYNVKWSWSPYERRHANSVGAAFMAATVDQMAREGVDGAAVWHAMGNAYGLKDDDGRMRAPGQLFLWANRYLHGEVAAAEAEVEGFVAIPITMADGHQTVLLINQTNAAMTLPAATALLATDKPIRHLAVTADGGRVADDDGAAITLPGYAVLFLTTAPGDETSGNFELEGQHVKFDF